MENFSILASILLIISINGELPASYNAGERNNLADYDKDYSNIYDNDNSGEVPPDNPIRQNGIPSSNDKLNKNIESIQIHKNLILHKDTTNKNTNKPKINLSVKDRGTTSTKKQSLEKDHIITDSRRKLFFESPIKKDSTHTHISECGPNAIYKLGKIPERTCQTHVAMNLKNPEYKFVQSSYNLGMAFSCFCKEHYIRDETTNNCIKETQCKTEQIQSCGENEEYRHDYIPEPNCDQRAVHNYDKQFKTDCFCIYGFIRSFIDSKCVRISQCNKGTQPITKSTSKTSHMLNSPCNNDEVYSTGFWPERNCVNKFQIRKFKNEKLCYCKPGTIRYSSSRSPCLKSCTIVNSLQKDRYNNNMHDSPFSQNNGKFMIKVKI